MPDPFFAEANANVKRALCRSYAWRKILHIRNSIEGAVGGRRVAEDRHALRGPFRPARSTAGGGPPVRQNSGTAALSNISPERGIVRSCGQATSYWRSLATPPVLFVGSPVRGISQRRRAREE